MSTVLVKHMQDLNFNQQTTEVIFIPFQASNLYAIFKISSSYLKKDEIPDLYH